MTFNIKFDYRFDRSGFFNQPERRIALEAAGQFWSGVIQDEFANVFSAGETIQVPISSVVKFTPTNYRIETESKSATLGEPIDDLLIFVYGLNLPPETSTLGSGGPAGTWIVDSPEDVRFNGSNFEPWLGTIYLKCRLEGSRFYR